MSYLRISYPPFAPVLGAGLVASPSKPEGVAVGPGDHPSDGAGPTPADFTYASRKGSLVSEEINRLVGEFTSAAGHKRQGGVCMVEGVCVGVRVWVFLNLNVL
jgi:hypothetical protein